MTDKACAHPNITRAVTRDDTYMWRCTKPSCRMEFVPQSDVDVIAAVMASEKVDMAAGVMSAMLWDFHERAVEKYGQRVAEAVGPNSPERDAMFGHKEDDGHVHEWNAGQCVHCGASMYL